MPHFEVITRSALFVVRSLSLTRRSAANASRPVRYGRFHKNTRIAAVPSRRCVYRSATGGLVIAWTRSVEFIGRMRSDFRASVPPIELAATVSRITNLAVYVTPTSISSIEIEIS